MVKSDFFKTMKNTNFFKNYSKPLALLAILIILSIVLFSSVNEYTLENFKPKPDIEVEIFLWVDSYGSTQNDLASQWAKFKSQYGNIPNITLGRASATEFTKYLELDKYPELNLDTNKSLEVLKSVDLTKDNSLLPFVSIFFVGTKEGKAYKSPLGIGTGKEVTYDNASKAINTITSMRMFSDVLYKSDVDIAPVVNAATSPAAPTVNAATSPAAAVNAVIPNSIGSVGSIGSSFKPWGKSN
jgi:hypothetical protein